MPLRYVHGLAGVIEAKGGKIFEKAPAVKIEKSGDNWRVITAGGSVTARHVVLCCSIYVDGLNKKLANACFPVRTFVMATQPMPRDILRSAINNDYAIYDNRFCSDYYRTVDNGTRILWGGRVALTDQLTRGDRALRDRLQQAHAQEPLLRQGAMLPEAVRSFLLLARAALDPQDTDGA